MKTFKLSAGVMLVVLWSGCGGETAPSFFETFKVMDHEGASAPEQFSGVANGSVNLVIAYQPNQFESFGERPVQPPEQWRFWWDFLDESGDAVDLHPLRFAEFYPFEQMGMEGTTGRGADRVLDWASPEKPPTEAEGLIAMWGRIRLAVEPGVYTLVVKAYPTADVRMPGEEPPIRGEGVVAFSAPITVTAPEPGHEPPPMNVLTSTRCTPRLRKRKQNEFGRPSEMFLASQKK